MSEKYISTDNKGKLFSALLADLPKAFQCFSHTFLIVKPHAYGFSIATLRLIYSYLSNRKQRTNVNLSCIPLEGICLVYLKHPF